MPFIDLANVACGFHGGDPVVMRETVRAGQAARRAGSARTRRYPDLQGFGRREMEMDRDELTAAIVYQVGALKGFLDAEGMELTHVKPHGALYGMAARDEEIAGGGRGRRRRVRRAGDGHGRHAARAGLHASAASASSPSTTPTSTTATTAR